MEARSTVAAQDGRLVSSYRHITRNTFWSLLRRTWIKACRWTAWKWWRWSWFASSSYRRFEFYLVSYFFARGPFSEFKITLLCNYLFWCFWIPLAGNSAKGLLMTFLFTIGLAMTGTVWTTCHPLMSHHRSMMQLLLIPAVIHSVYTDWHWIGVKTAPSLWQAVHPSQQEISPQSANVCLDQQQNYPRQIKNYVGASSVYMCQCSIIVQTFAAVTS